MDYQMIMSMTGDADRVGQWSDRGLHRVPVPTL